MAMTKEQKKQKKINTDNRMVTINKREVSLQGLVSKFENGEDGIYNLITNDKNILFTPKIAITEKDLEEIPELKQLHDSILQVEQYYKKVTGKKKFLLKQQLIQMRQDQYVIKNSYRKPIYCMNLIKNFHNMTFDDNIQVLQDGTIKDHSILSLMNPQHISILLRNYSSLRQNSYGRFTSDSYCLIRDLENLIDKTLEEKYPLYYYLVIYKIDKKPNTEIQLLLEKKFGIKHSIEYISSLWRHKIPKLIADQAEKDYLNWYFLNEKKGKWKKCSCCGEIKLAHNKFFSKNSSSKDGFYSICKECRNKKAKEKNKKMRKVQIVKRIKLREGEGKNGEKSLLEM